MLIRFLKKHYSLRYHGVYQHAKKLFVFDLVLLAAVILMIAGNIFLFFWKPSLTGLIDLSISLGNERIKSGEMTHVTINFTNNNKVPLKEVSLALRLPEGFIIDRKQTSAELFSDHSIFTRVKELDPGASGQEDVYGWFWMEPKTEEHFIANLSYRPDSNNNREQKLASVIANLPESVLVGTLNFPTSTFSSFPVTFTYTLQNSTDRAISDITIIKKLNNKEILSDATSITLPPKGTKVVEGQFLTPSQPGNYTFSVVPQILANNHAILQLPSVKTFQTFAPQIVSSAKLIQPPTYAEPGQSFPVQITWQNKSDLKLQNLTLHLTSNLAGVIDWKKTAQQNHATTETNGMFFDNQSRTSLSDGNPQNSDTFTITIYLLPIFNAPAVENVNLEIYPVMKAGLSQITDQNFSQEGSRTTIPLATELHFNNTEARYYTPEGDQLGRGPLPPQVGKTTKYWIFVKITNSSNAVSDPSFSTSLPPGIEFTGKQSTTIGPQINFNPSDRSISWQYTSLPANSQTGLYFEVAVTPSAAQLGQDLILTNSLHFSATDSFIGKKFDLSHTPILNILNRNDQGYNLGAKVIQ